MAEYSFSVDELEQYKPVLKAGDRVYLSGCVYTARDAAHKRITQTLSGGGESPFPLKGAVIYYAGPTPAPQGMAAGSIGPTTSGRMDVYTPLMLENGLSAMIGKGGRSSTVREKMRATGAVYFCATGGAGALYSSCIKQLEVIAYPELGCESVKRLTVENFPLTVGIDASGESLFKE